MFSRTIIFNKKFFIFILIITFQISCNQSRIPDDILIVGAYSDSSHQGSIHFFAYFEDSNKVTEINIDGDTLIANASFLDFNDSIIFAVQEQQPGYINIIKYVFSNNEQNKVSLKRIQTLSAFGKDPCYIQLSPDHKALAVANYSSGNFVLYNLNLNQTIDTAHIQTINFLGSGKDPIRQEMSHCHAVQFNTHYKQLFISDLGLDKIYIFNYQTTPFYSIPNKPTDSISLNLLSGPRHFTFSKDNQFLFVVEELSGYLSIFKKFPNKWQEIDKVKLYESEDERLILASADIHISSDEKFIYVSNRIQENNIAVLLWDKEKQQASLVQKIDVAGQTPRNFFITNNQKQVWVANQNSNEVKLFLRDSVTGKLSPSKISFNVYKPAFVKSMYKK